MNDEVTSFMEKYGKQRDGQHNQLEGFESDITALSNVDLHPSLRSGDRGTLLDSLDEKKLRDYRTQCQALAASLANKVDKLSTLVNDVHNGMKAHSDPFAYLAEYDLPAAFHVHLVLLVLYCRT
jgi:hypothetical protein